MRRAFCVCDCSSLIAITCLRARKRAITHRHAQPHTRTQSRRTRCAVQPPSCSPRLRARAISVCITSVRRTTTTPSQQRAHHRPLELVVATGATQGLDAIDLEHKQRVVTHHTCHTRTACAHAASVSSLVHMTNNACVRRESAQDDNTRQHLLQSRRCALVLSLNKNDHKRDRTPHARTAIVICSCDNTNAPAPRARSITMPSRTPDVTARAPTLRHTHAQTHTSNAPSLLDRARGAVSSAAVTSDDHGAPLI
jgi:hypothetical protein